MLGVLVVTTPITPSGSFSVETLTGLTPLWKTELNRSISVMEDGISRVLQHCYETCCEKDGHCGRQTCMVQKWFHCGDVVSRQVDLYMTLMASLCICCPSLFSGILAQTPSSFFLSVLISLVLLLSLTPHLLLQILSLLLLKISLLIYTLITSFPDLLIYSPSKCLPILPVHMTRSIRSVHLLPPLSSSSLYIVYKLL